MTLRVAAILAGGESRRFGADKVMADLVGAPLVTYVAAALNGDRLAVVGHSQAASLLNAEDLRDPPGAVRGPLAGVLAALEWAGEIGAAWLMTAPADTPLLPRDLYPRLIEVAEKQGRSAAYACTSEGVHALCSVWRPFLSTQLRESFAQGIHPQVRALAPDAAHVLFDNEEAFVNINTPDDMVRAQRRLGAR